MTNQTLEIVGILAGMMMALFGAFFAESHASRRHLETKMDDGFKEVRKEFDEVRKEFVEVRKDLSAVQGQLGYLAGRMGEPLPSHLIIAGSPTGSHRPVE